MKARREVAIGLGCYGAYLAIRRVVWNDAGRAQAERNAARVVLWERRFGIDIESSVQQSAVRHPRVVSALNLGYGAGNVALSVGWLIFLFRRGNPRFLRERRAAAIALTAALPVFLVFPVAPPRRRDGYVDTLLDGGFDLEAPGIVRLYNPIAAMPSHHMAFGVVTGFGLAASSSRTPVRRLWRLYPAAVGWVVIATGNHYLLDVAAGAVVGSLARAVTR